MVGVGVVGNNLKFKTDVEDEKFWGYRQMFSGYFSVVYASPNFGT